MKRIALTMAALAAFISAAHANDRLPLVLVNGQFVQLNVSDALGLTTLHVSGASNLAAATASSLTMSGAIDLASHQIHNVTDPTSPQDAATQAYVLAHAGGGGGGITNSAGNNVVMKSNGTNAVASSITDDGSTVTASVPYVTSNLVQSFNGAVSLDNGFVNAGYNTNALATLYLNRTGFHQGTANFRNTEIDDGKGVEVCLATGSTNNLNCNELGVGSRALISSTQPSYFVADNPNVSNKGYVGFGRDGATAHGSPIDIQSDFSGLTTPAVGAGSTANTMLNMFTADFFDMTASSDDVLMYGLHINRGGDEIPSGPHKMTIVAADYVVGSATAHYMVSVRTEDFPGQSIGTVEQHAGHMHRHTGLPMANPSCGTSGTVSGDDVQGAETVGSGTVTSCAMTFREPWVQETETGTCPSPSSCTITTASVIPNCTVTSRSGVVLSYTPTATTLTVTASSLTSSTFDWHCEAPN